MIKQVWAVVTHHFGVRTQVIYSQLLKNYSNPKQK